MNCRTIGVHDQDDFLSDSIDFIGTRRLQTIQDNTIVYLNKVKSPEKLVTFSFGPTTPIPIMLMESKTLSFILSIYSSYVLLICASLVNKTIFSLFFLALFRRSFHSFWRNF